MLFTDWIKYREEEENRDTKQRQRQNMAAGNKNGGKTIERLHSFTDFFFLTNANCYRHKEKRQDVYE